MIALTRKLGRSALFDRLLERPNGLRNRHESREDEAILASSGQNIYRLGTLEPESGVIG
jgi:hypothetical protein